MHCTTKKKNTQNLRQSQTVNQNELSVWRRDWELLQASKTILFLFELHLNFYRLFPLPSFHLVPSLFSHRRIFNAAIKPDVNLWIFQHDANVRTSCGVRSNGKLVANSVSVTTTTTMHQTSFIFGYCCAGFISCCYCLSFFSFFLLHFLFERTTINKRSVSIQKIWWDVILKCVQQKSTCLRTFL